MLGSISQIVYVYFPVIPYSAPCAEQKGDPGLWLLKTTQTILLLPYVIVIIITIVVMITATCIVINDNNNYYYNYDDY